MVLRLQLSQVGTLALAQDLGATILERLQFGLHALGNCELLLDALLLRLDLLLEELVASLEEVDCHLLASLAASKDIVEAFEDGVVRECYLCDRVLAHLLRWHVALAEDLVVGSQSRQHEQHPLDVGEVALGDHDAGLEPHPVSLAQELLDKYLGGRRLRAVAEADVVLVRHPEFLAQHVLEVGLVHQLAC